MEQIKKYFSNDKFAAHNNIQLMSVSPGRATAEMVVSENHHNGLGTVHGGALFSLADFTFAAAANSHGTVSVAINTHMSFLKAVTSGVLTAEAEEVSVNPKIGSYIVRIFHEGEIIAIFEGMAYRKKNPISDYIR